MPNHEIKTNLSALNSTLSAITKFPITISSKTYKTPTTIASNSSTITLSKSETTATKASSTKISTTSNKIKIETTTTTNSATTTYSASSKIKSETATSTEASSIITSGTISSAKLEKIRRIRNLPEIYCEAFEEQKSSELCLPIKKYFFKFIIFLEFITLKPIIN